MTPTTPSVPAMPHVEKHRVPFVAPFTGAESMRKFHPYVHNLRASYADELENIVDFYASTGIKRFSVLHYDDAVGKENLGAVETALIKRGLKPVSISSVKRNQLELGDAVSGMIKSTPDVVTTTTLYRTTADSVKQAKSAGSGAQFAITSCVGASVLATELGQQGAGMLVAQV